MLKQFFLKQAMKLGNKNLSKEQIDIISKLLEKNPKFFEQIAKEIKDSTGGGMPEPYAAFQIMKKYEKELQSLVAESGLSVEEIQKLAQAVGE